MRKHVTHSRLVQDLRDLMRQPDAVISIIGVAIAVTFAILDLVNISDDLMLPALLAVTSALATSQIISQVEQVRESRSKSSMQQQIESMNNMLSEIKASISGRGTALFKRLGDLAPLEERLANAETIDIKCATCNSIFSSYGWLIKKKYEEGCKIRILLAYDPEWDDDNELLTALIFNQQAHTPTVDVYKGEIEQGIEIFRNLGLFTQSSKGGKVEIHRLNYFPVCSYFITNGRKSDALIKVEIYVTGYENWGRPHFFVSRREDQDWYEFFANHFETLWAASTSLI